MPGQDEKDTVAAVHFCHVSKRFGPIKALDDVDFSVQRGTIVAFLGPNGAGKTTAMRLMTQFLLADDGSVEIAGTRVGDLRDSTRSDLGYLSENAALYSDMRVGEFLLTCAHLRGLSSTAARDAVRHVARTCHLTTVIERPIAVLSKGYRQRVGLAQAMVHNPSLLILDEPTTGLDPNQVNDLLAVIRDMRGQNTVILSTHILSHVEQTCDHVLLLSEGRLVFDGSPRAMREQGNGITHLTWVVDRTLDELVEITRGRPFVADVVLAGERDGYSIYELSGTFDRDALVTLLDEGTRRGFRTGEYRPHALTLDQVFQQLTREGQSHA